MPLLLRESDVRALVSINDAIEAMERAFWAQAMGTASLQPRQRIRWPGGALHVMAAGGYGLGYAGLKAYTSVGRQTRFVVLLFSTETGDLLAVIEADWLGRLRTGAVSGLATRYLASPTACVLGLYGSGRQAETQLLAIHAVRSLQEVRVFSPNPAHRTKFAHYMREQLGIPVYAVDRPEEAAKGADIITTITTSAEPVLQGDWLSPGVHINAAGSNALTRRELDDAVIERADVIVVDSIEQARLEAGDFLRPIERGRLQWTQVHELKDVVSQKVKREDDRQVTLFKSLGVAIEDVALAAVVYERAQSQGIGEPFPWGAER